LAINFPGPYEVRVNYLTNEPASVATHELRLSCRMNTIADPGDPFDQWTPYVKNGTFAATLNTRVDSLITWIKPFFHSAVTFVNAELWEYVEGSFDAAYRSAYALGVVGTGVAATVVGSQSILTLRTFNGGIMKIDLRGTNISPAAKTAIPGSGIIYDLAQYMIAATNPWWARDNSYAAVPLFWLPGQNEHAFKVLYR